MADGPAITVLDGENPWPGLDSYTEPGKEFFYGRDLERAELLRLIRLSPFVALYGKSGLGKTSLLQAGLFPHLRAARFLPVYLRLDYSQNAEHTPLEQALARLQQEIDTSGADATPPQPGEGLWAYLQRRERPIWTRDNFPLTPVLVFDQFEEVFSRGGSPAHVKSVLGAIADLVGDRFTSELVADPHAAQRLNLQSQQYRIVLSFRSDFLADVETWERQANLPKHDALYLKALSRDTAIYAIDRAGVRVLDPGVAPQIVDFVLARDEAGEQGRITEVEPVLLSLCCYQLNNRRLRPAKIDGALLKSVGKDILLGFYNEALEGMPHRVSVFIEDNLIQGGRYRSSFPYDEAIASRAVTESELARLMSRRLLRVEPYGDVRRIELIHDRLVSVVHEAKNTRLRRERDQRKKLGLDAETLRGLESLGYEVEELVHEGAFGVVYRATREPGGLKVALTLAKNRREDVERPSSTRDLSANASTVARRLQHENVVCVMEVHENAGRRVLIVPWVDGVPITRALQGADWDAKSRAIGVVCATIEYMHRQGIIHGNIKPGNLLVGSDGKPKLLETGLLQPESNANRTSRRDSSTFAYADNYLAPEQLGRAKSPTPATDVYAVGAIFYELLTEEPPFGGKSSYRTVDALHDAPELPMLKRPDVPEPLQRICLKALEKRPEDRYSSIGEMREDLERYRQGKVVSVRPSYYNNLIESPARGHVAAIDRWHDHALITDQEHVQLRRAYQSLTRSGLQAISESRLVHWLVLVLYLGGWLALDGATGWLGLYYGGAPESTLGLANSRIGRISIGLVPALVANGIWKFFYPRGSYRFAFAAMIVGLISLPFAVGVTLHEVVEWLWTDVLRGPEVGTEQPPGGTAGGLLTLLLVALHTPVDWSGKHLQFFNDAGAFPNIQLFISLSVAVVWGAYVAIQSRTLTSAAIIGVYFVLLYLVGLDFWGLRDLFEKRISYGGMWTLPAAFALVAAGVYAGRTLHRPRQAAPLFAIALIVAILASQAIAIKGPTDWHWARPIVGAGAIEVALGIVYLACSRYLRGHFRVEAAAAYLVLAWIAPLAFLGGITLMDLFWGQEDLPTVTFLAKEITPWSPVLLASSILVVFFAARFNSIFYIICGVCFLDYASMRITFTPAAQNSPNWLWPFFIFCAGLAVIGWLAWRDYRTRTSEDIDDVGERLIERSRRIKVGVSDTED